MPFRISKEMFCFPMFQKMHVWRGSGHFLVVHGGFSTSVFFELISELAEISSHCLSVKRDCNKDWLQLFKQPLHARGFALPKSSWARITPGSSCRYKGGSTGSFWALFWGFFGAAATTNDSAGREQQAQPAEQGLGWRKKV